MSDVKNSLTARTAARLRRMAAADMTARDLNNALRFLAKWRCLIIEAEVVKRHHVALLSGPFAGMKYSANASEGARLPRMLGHYEASLAPIIEQIIDRAYPLVLDIGSAEGYYAVGLARRMPHSRILARDGNEIALKSCMQLARANDVADRVETGGVLSHADFALCRPYETVIICDIEGAEADLLNPDLAPELRKADLLVEVHEGMRAGTMELLKTRFAASHHIQEIYRTLKDDDLPDWMENLSDLDRLLVLWEWRSSPTPWLWMTCK